MPIGAVPVAPSTETVTVMVLSRFEVIAGVIVLVPPLGATEVGDAVTDEIVAMRIPLLEDQPLSQRASPELG